MGSQKDFTQVMETKVQICVVAIPAAKPPLANRRPARQSLILKA
jgi:hypothetical protein